MVSEWLSGKIGDIADLIMGQSPLGETCNEVGQGVPLLNGPTEFGENHPRPVQFTTDPRKFAEPGDLLFCVRGSTTGRMNWADQRYAIGRGLAAIRAKKGEEYRYFVHGVVNANLPRLLASATGSTFPNVSKEQIQEIRCAIPPLAEQKAIAGVLGALDDKIEQNRQMNATLEAMARAIFQSWFVDFDPVRAKMDGRAPAGMDAETAALFPDSFEDSPLGPIPKGWKMGTIGDNCLYIQNGGTPRRDKMDFWDRGTIPWLTSGEVRQAIITNANNSITELGFSESSAKWVPSYSTVVALYGATAGQVSFITLPLTTNQAVCSLIPKKFCSFYNYMCMRNATSELENKAVGSAQQNISKQIVEETKIILPSLLILKKFELLVKPLFTNWISNINQSRTLADLRDALLPKLLSGELSVEHLIAP